MDHYRLLRHSFLLLLLLFTICWSTSTAKNQKIKPKHENNQKKPKKSHDKNGKTNQDGTNHTSYGKELELLAYAHPAIEQMENQRQQSARPVRRLLIATFLNASNNFTVTNLHDNIRRLPSFVDMAAIIYAGSPLSVHHACHPLNLTHRSSFVHCRRASITHMGSYKVFPKPVLYPELLPYLHAYDRVMLIDEDISLKEADFADFLKTWGCLSWGSSQPPLIVQALISEETQFSSMVSWTAWKAHANTSTVVGAESKFIEQQVPAFDSRFLFWFIEYVLAHWLEKFLQFQSDWGTDGIWCGAADGFAREVGWVDPKDLWFTPCALLTNTRPFHHLNAHTLSSKAQNKRDFSSRGTQLRNLFRKEFPSWGNERVMQVPNPLFEGSGLRLFSSMNYSCASDV